MFANIYILAILSNCNHLCGIYYTCIKKFKCIVVKKRKNAIEDNEKICTYKNISILNIQPNQ